MANQIIGTCIEVHNTLGSGFLEIIYQDALVYECQQKGIPFQREKEYPVPYKYSLLNLKPIQKKSGH